MKLDRSNTLRRAATAGVLVSGVVALAVGLARRPVAAQPVARAPVPTASARTTMVFATGTLAADRTLPLAFDRAGTLGLLRADVGSIVEPGALVAQLEDRDTRVAVERERAGAATERSALAKILADEALVRARVEIARREAARSARLFTVGGGTEFERDRSADALAVSTLELESLRAQRPAVRARVAQAQARVALATITHERDALRAPARARVLRSDLAQGAFVGAGQTVVQLALVGDELASVWVHESELPSIRVGARATVTLRDRAHTRFDATVLRVRPEADPRTHEVRVDLRPTTLPPVVVFGVRLDAEIERATDGARP
jgi:multidrug efflux pump subunit AcrA (membrane-fusion protein)